MGRKNKKQGRARPAPPAATPPFSWAEFFSGHGRHALVVFAGLFIVYLATMPQVVTYEDEAIFNLICHFGQPAHPPGYPLYSMLCFPFAQLPFLSPPVAGNLLSALLGAAACAVLYLVAVMLNVGPGGAYLAGFGYGFSRLFWSQSIIQEVYSLHALLVLLMLLLALVYVRGRNPAHLKWFAVVCGLGLSNHWVLTVLVAPALPLLLLPARRELLRQLGRIKNFAMLAGLFVAAAALPYTYLLVTNLPSPVNFYGPLDHAGALLHYVAREGYALTDNQQVSWFEKALYMKLVLTESLAQYGVVFLLFAVGGFLLQWRRWPWSVCWALVVLYLSTTFLLVWLVDFKYDELWAGVFSIYPIIAWCTLALWGALGFECVLAFVRTRCDALGGRAAGFLGFLTTARGPGAALSALLSALLIATVAFSNLGFNNRSGDRFAFNQARAVLESVDENAVMLLATDFQLPIMELNLLEGVREDVTLYNMTGLFLSNRYLAAHGNRAKQDQAAADFVARTRRPIYYVREFAHDYGVESFCLYNKVRKDWPAGRRKLTLLPEFLALWDESELQGDDLHFDAQAKRLFRRCMVGMIVHAEDTDPALLQAWQARLTDGDYYDLLSLIRFVSLWHESPPQSVTLQQLLERIAQLPPPSAVRPKDRAELLYARAFDQINRMSPAEWRSREAMGETLALLRKSLAIYPSAENPSAQSLLRVLAGLTPKDEAALAALRARYPFVQ